MGSGPRDRKQLFATRKLSWSEKLISDCLKTNEEGSKVRGKFKFLLACFAFFFFVTFTGTVGVYSQGTLCYFTSTQVSPGQGASVPAGQLVQFQIILTGSCPTPGIYTIRADLINPANSEVISTNQELLPANGPFIATLGESLSAPPTIGPWDLQLSAYVLLNGAVVAPASQETFGLNVVPYTPTSTVATAETMIVESTNTTSSSLIQPTTIQPSVTEFSTVGSASQVVGATNSSLLFSVQLIVAVLAILVILVVLFKARRDRHHGTAHPP